MFFFASPAWADSLAETKAALEKAGVKVQPTGVLLASEAELTKELGKSAQLRKNLTLAQKDLQAAERQLEKFRTDARGWLEQEVQLSVRLANVDPNNIDLYNKLVGAVNAIRGQLKLSEQQEDKLKEELKTVRIKTNEIREAYIQFALETRKLADKISAEYATKGADADVKSLLAKYNEAAGKQFALAPTAGFNGNLKRLKQLEDAVLSESIPLRDDGQQLWVNVTALGKYQEEMVVSSGASIVILTKPVAARFGLKMTDKDPEITLIMADGRELHGRQINIPSLRVGKFIVENVECAVLGADAVAAQPTLGRTFLEKFKFEIDPAAKTLTMVKVAAGDGSKLAL